MKRNAIKLVFVSMLTILAINAFAGSLDTLSNQSAGYVLNTAQNGSTDGAGIVPYNPAGTALLEKGFYLDVSNQSLLKFYSESEDVALNETYDMNGPTPFLPNLFLAYNFGTLGLGKLSVYGQAGIVAGGGSLAWEDGTIGTNAFAATAGSASYTTEIEASSVYYGFGGGIGYSLFDDKLSLSAGVKYVDAKRSAKISGTLDYTAFTVDLVDDYEYSATGITPVFGFDVRPLSGLTIGLRYEMETELNFEYSMNERSATTASTLPVAIGTAAAVGGMLPDFTGVEVNQNLPQVISVGAEYVFNPKFTASAGTTFYLLNLADLEGGEDSFGLGVEITAGAKYQVTDKLMLGGTFMHTRQNVKDSLWEDDDALLTVSANPSLDSLYFGLGGEYAVMKNVGLLLSAAYVYYMPEEATTNAGMEVSYEKQVVNLGIALKCKL